MFASLGSIDLSEAIYLKEVYLACDTASPKWIFKTLRTITCNHKSLKRVSFATYCHSGFDFDYPRREAWSEFDNFLTQFCESHSIRVEVLYYGARKRVRGERARLCVGALLPEAIKSGIVDLDECSN